MIDYHRCKESNWLKLKTMIDAPKRQRDKTKHGMAYW